MKKNIIASALAALVAMGMSSCNTNAINQAMGIDHNYKDSKTYGAVVTKNIDAEVFDKIETAGGVKLIYRQGDMPKVSVTGNEKCLEQYDITISDGRLYARLKEGWRKGIFEKKTPVITINVSIPSVCSLISSGGADVEMQGTIRQDVPLEVEMSGAADLNIDSLYLPGLRINISGAGDCDLNYIKSDGDISADISGAGDLNGEISCRNLDLSVSGAGDMDVRVDCSGQLNADASGAADITVSGTCRTLVRHSSGASDLNLRKLKVLEE